MLDGRLEVDHPDRKRTTTGQTHPNISIRWVGDQWIRERLAPFKGSVADVHFCAVSVSASISVALQEHPHVNSTGTVMGIGDGH